MKVTRQDRREIDKLKRWFDSSKIIHYLKERQNEEGGFSLAIDLYPDIELDSGSALDTGQMQKLSSVIRKKACALLIEQIN
jgi:hypothetical protein